jgi:preprotein translocase subunit SecG
VIIKKIKELNKRHQAWIKGNGYKFNKLLFMFFFLISLILLLIIVYTDGVYDKVWVSCPEWGTFCENPLKELGCAHMCCEIDFLAPGQSCGEPTSWLAKNYSWLVFVLFVIVLFINHFSFNKGYNWDRYWGDFK